jgi:starch synthase
MKCGITTADKITTVSDTYAKEILYDYFGQGLSGILKSREHDLVGIVNGIDYDDFNPKEDKKIEYNYGLYNYLKGKATNKAALREIFNLDDNKLPIVSVVSRITEAKGFDLITEIIEDLIQQGNMQFVLLGSGDSHTEDYFQYLSRTYPGKVGAYIGYSDELARKIYAGSDFFLMPSRFEPCGLAQLISLKYGTIPIVRKTGGLKDTIESYNQYTKEGTGFAFDQYDAFDLKDAIERGLSIYRDKTAWKQLVRRAMQEDFSFDESAKKYLALYEGLKEE